MARADGCRDVLKAYHEEFDKLTERRLGDLHAVASDIKTSLEDSKLVIVPSPFPNWSEWWDRYESRTHIGGVLMTVLFLSLGAPFWYNTLR